MKNYIFIEKLQKYQPDHQAKLITINILEVNKYYLLITKKNVGQTKFIYSSLGKAFEKV